MFFYTDTRKVCASYQKQLKQVTPKLMKLTTNLWKVETENKEQLQTLEHLLWKENWNLLFFNR